MSTNLSLDVGENTLRLLEEFSKTIGTTTDKVFPWFVTNQVIDGYMSLIVPLIFIILGAIVTKCYYKKAKWDEVEVNGIMTAIGLIMFGFGSIISVAISRYSISAILNPSYGATKDLINTISKLVH